MNVDKIKNHWLVWVGTIVIGAIGLYWQYEDRRHELGGRLNASIQHRMLNNRGSRTIVVCMENKDIDLSHLNITPIFDNPSEFSLKDFALSFEIESENVELEPTSFFTIHQYGKNKTIYRYNDNILPAYEDTETPFMCFHVQNNIARCAVNTKATYDGASSAFEYHTDVWFVVEKRNHDMSIGSWKMSCKKRIFDYIQEPYYDLYYFANGEIPEYVFDVALESPFNKENIESVVPELELVVAEDVESFGKQVKNKDHVKCTQHSSRPKEEKVNILDKIGLSVKSCSISHRKSYTKLTFQLSEPVVNDGMYLLCFRAYKNENQCEVKDYKTIERILNGTTSISINWGEQLDSVSDFCLYQSVNAYQYVKEKKTKDNKLCIENISNYKLLCAVIYSNNSCYYKEIRSGYEEYIDSDEYYIFLLGEDKESNNKASFFSIFLVILGVVGMVPFFMFIAFVVIEVCEDKKSISDAILLGLREVRGLIEDVDYSVIFHPNNFKDWVDNVYTCLICILWIYSIIFWPIFIIYG